MLAYRTDKNVHFISHYRIPTLAPVVAPVILTLLSFSLLSLNLLAQNVSAQNASVQDLPAYYDNGNQTVLDKNNTKTNKLVSSNSINSAAINTSVTSNQDRQSPPLQAKDRFGIDMLYPSKPGGEEWFMNMADPMSDFRFNPQDKITRNADGSWKIKSDQVRMYVSTSNGYNPHQITSDSGQSRVAARGFMGSPHDWRDIEITGYVKLNKFSENDNFVWYTRGGKHTDSDPCQGSSYKGNLFYHGETQFAKEQWHVSYAKSPTISATNPLEGKWIGFKFAMYNFVTGDGKSAVKLENWIDTNADGKNWEKVYEGADAGKWGRSGTDCEVKADQIIKWGGPLATFRWDFAPDVDFKDLSVREITGQNGTMQGVSYFTGSSTSSNVPEFGNTTTSKEGQSNLMNPTTHELPRRQIGDGAIGNSNNESSVPDSNIKPETPGNNPIGGEISHEIRVDSGNMVFVTWVQGDEDNTDIYLKISEDGGVTFGSPINLSNNPSSLSYNQKVVATDNNNVYVVWEDDDGNSENSDIYFVSSSDGGKSFSGKINLSNDPSGSGNPVISVSGNDIYVAWSGTSPDSTDILMAHSSDGGDTFSVPVNLSNDPEISYNPKLYLNGSSLLVQWTDQDDTGAINTKGITLPNVSDASPNQDNDKSISATNNTTTDFESVEQNSTDLVSLEENDSNSTNATARLDSSTENQTSRSAPLTTELTNSNPNSTITNSNSSSILPAPPTINYESELHNTTIVDYNGTEDHISTNPIPNDVEVNKKFTLANIGSDDLATIVADAEEALKAKESKNAVKQLDISTEITTDFEANTMQQQQQVQKEPTNKEPQQQMQLPGQLQQDQGQPVSDSEGSIEANQGEQNVASGSLVTQKEPTSPVGTTGNSLPDTTLQEESHQQDDEQQAQLQGKVQGQSRQQQEQQQGEKQNSGQVITFEIENQHPQAAINSPQPLPQHSSEVKDQQNENENENENQAKIKAHEQKRPDQQLEQEKQRATQEQIQIQLEKKLHEQKRQQLQEIDARQNVQNLIGQANNAFAQAQELVKQAKISNQKAQAAADAYFTQRKGTIPSAENKDQYYELLPPEIKSLVNEAKIADQKALEAVDRYNELRKAADQSVAEFNTQYGN